MGLLKTVFYPAEVVYTAIELVDDCQIVVGYMIFPDKSTKIKIGKQKYSIERIDSKTRIVFVQPK